MTHIEAERFNLILRRSEGGFSESEMESLSLYYRLVMKWNPRLHLTTITEPQEFFERHIFESVLVEGRVLPLINQLWDLGSGAGVPGLVIAIRRPTLPITLVEASHKKSIFLKEAISELHLQNVKVIKDRFETLDQATPSSCITARAIDGMGRLLQEILEFGSQASQMILLGGNRLNDALRLNLNEEWSVKSYLIPGSMRRYLVNAIRST